MGCWYEGGGHNHIDEYGSSYVPIQRIINRVQELYPLAGHSVSFGKHDAKISFQFQNVVPKIVLSKQSFIDVIFDRHPTEKQYHKLVVDYQKLEKTIQNCCGGYSDKLLFYKKNGSFCFKIFDTTEEVKMFKEVLRQQELISNF